MSVRQKDTLVLVGLLCLGLAAAALVIYVTVMGPWAFSDSAAYLASARSFARGTGLGYLEASGSYNPLTVHPPLYPILLSGILLTGLDPIESVRWLNAILIFAFILSSGWLFYRITTSALLPLTLGVLLLAYPEIVDAFSGMMTETIFLPIGFSGLLLTILGIKENNMRKIWISFVLLLGSVLTRYTGLAFLFAGLFSVLCFHRALPFAQRVRRVGLAALLTSLPLIAWFGWVYAMGDGFGGRGAGLPSNFFLDSQDYFSRIAAIIVRWIPFSYIGKAFFPLTFKVLAILLLAAAVFFGYLHILKRRQVGMDQAAATTHLILALLVFVAAHIAIHYASEVFSDHTEISTRLLAPILVAVLIILVSLMALLGLASRGSKWVSILAVVLLLVVIAFQFPKLTKFAQDLHDHGRGYSADNLHVSQLIRRVGQLPGDSLLASNDPGMLLYYTDRPAYKLNRVPAAAAFTKIIFLGPLRDVYAEKTDEILGSLTAGCFPLYQDAAGLILDCKTR